MNAIDAFTLLSVGNLAIEERRWSKLGSGGGEDFAPRRPLVLADPKVVEGPGRDPGFSRFESGRSTQRDRRVVANHDPVVEQLLSVEEELLNMTCPCGAGPSLDACCGPFLRGEDVPSTAEQLMRSRYSAFSEGNVDYVIETHHPETRDDLDRAETKAWAHHSRWQRLDVVDAMHGKANDTEGTVEFIAHYERDGDDCMHHELSRFRKEDGRWYYYDGETPSSDPVVRETPKVGRNAPCPCGSGKKFKRCCGRPGA